MYIETSDQPRLKLGFGDYECNWGVHLCGLYETESERDDILMGFLNQGDLDGDVNLYGHCERSRADFQEKYTDFCPACAEHLHDSDRFQFFPAQDLYYPDGRFSPWAMEQGLEKFYADRQKEGPRNIRGIAEMVWALGSLPGVEHLMAYESRLNYFIPGKRWISICLYNVTKFSGSLIMDVLYTHPYTISRGVITENPYYQHPDVWLQANAPEFMERRAC